MTSTQVRTAYRAVLSDALTGTCPTCHGSFETCRCTGVVALVAPRAGATGGADREDNCFHQVVHQLVADGDSRAASAGRRARRTLDEMVPGQTLQPVLRMTRQLTFTPTVSRAGADDACVLCGYWTCRCGSSAVPAPSVKAVAS